MILVRIKNEKQNIQFEQVGVLEFGRGPQRDVPRCVLSDIYASRNHLRIEELPNGRVRLENLSSTRPILLTGGASIASGKMTTADLPVKFSLGNTQIHLDAPPARQPSNLPPLTPPSAVGHEDSSRTLTWWPWATSRSIR